MTINIYQEYLQKMTIIYTGTSFDYVNIVYGIYSIYIKKLIERLGTMRRKKMYYS